MVIPTEKFDLKQRGEMMSLSVERVIKKYRDFTAVNNVSFTLESGLYGLLGPNGAGKTTLMRMLVGVLNPTGGGILCDGENIRELGGRYRKILGYLPQQFDMYDDFTGKRFLEFVADLKGIDHAEAHKKIAECIEIVGMTGNEGKKIRKLSGGMKRRIGIAQALLNEPKVLVMDEPTSGLDPSERIRLRNYLQELSKDRIILLSTHIVADLESTADHILMLRRGELIANTTPLKLQQSLTGKVFTVSCDDILVEKLRQEFVISAMQRVDGKNEVRVVGDQSPALDAVSVSPRLEDVYMYYYGTAE